MQLTERNRNDATGFLILVGILVLLNLVSMRTFIRWDLTRTQAYSLSKISKQYMRQLQDPITVKAFFTRNLPPPYNANARYLRDLLEDYRAYSRGRFNYRFIDPAENPSLEQEARGLGVYGVQLTAIERDKFEQKNGYMGVAFMYHDRQEVIPLIQDTGGLEYQISSIIKKLVQAEMKVVGVTQGHGEPDLNQALSNFQELIAKNYEVVPVDLKTGSIPERVQTLVVAGPTEALSDEKLYLLDHFLRSGKSLAMLVQMVKADARMTMQAQIVNSRLSTLIAAWGVKIQPDFVYDLQCQKITVSQRGPGFIMQNIIPYPPFPMVTNFDALHPVVKNLEAITLPFVSSLTLDEGVVKANQLQASIVAKSSARAWRQQQFFMLSPQFIQPPAQPEQVQQFNLAVALTGAFPSAFTPATVPAPAEPGNPLPAFLDKAVPSRLFVVGGADFISNDFLMPQRGAEMGHFAQNVVDWVAQDAALIEIRSKGTEPAALAQVPEAQRQLVKYFNLVGLPILVMLAGLVMWRRFEARRMTIASKFQTTA